jgi:carbohydrate-selective porin OprB
LKIVTAKGSPNYFIKVVDWERGTPILTVFARSGQTVNVSVPLGSYRLKYASGTEWYGQKHLFGPDTAYGRAQDRFDFAVEGSQVSGYTVELIKQVGGNLQTVNIRPEDF